MAQTSAGPGPIPPARKDDSEDVAWALSTAEAMYARGERSDALKWLRRAAEAASEAEADDRALELAKAAAELATSLGPTTNAPPPPAASPPAPVIAPAAPPVVRPAPTPPPPPASKPAPAAAARAGHAPKPAARPPPTPAATPVAPRTDARRANRRSRPDILIARQSDEPTLTRTDTAVPLTAPRRRGRASKPAPEELTPAPPPPPPPPTPRERMPSHTDEIDQWPTQSTTGDGFGDPPEKTRIGVPAYEADAKAAGEDPAPEPPMQASQAVRVVVWRTPGGVRIAPQGTRVSAITVDAVLVALDPSADLAAWLSGK